MSDGTEKLKALAVPLAEVYCPAGKERLRQADVIWGLDKSRDELVIFWGRAALRKIVNAKKSRGVKIEVVEYDQRNQSLEKLAALVTVAKGACSYVDDE